MPSRFDSELSIEELFKRASQWTDKTLIQRLEKIGITPYKERYRRYIFTGRKAISPNRRYELIRLYIKHLLNITHIPTLMKLLPGRWWTLIKWLEHRANRNKALDVATSFNRLTETGIRYVFERNRKFAFTSSNTTEALKNNNHLPHVIVYQIDYDTSDGDEAETDSWMQASNTFNRGDPFSSEAIKGAKEEIETFQQRNEQTQQAPSAHAYTWWMNIFTKESEYKFIGLGVNVHVRGATRRKENIDKNAN